MAGKTAPPAAPPAAADPAARSPADRAGSAPAAPCADLGKLRWRCRRGLKELDVLLERYMDQRFGGAPEAEQEAFRQLLETEDTLIYAYCLRVESAPERYADLIERIIAN
jgi:antitoxin CptB